MNNKYDINSYWFKYLQQQAIETKYMRQFLKWKAGMITEHGLDPKWLKKCELMYEDLYDDTLLNESNSNA